jgi:uncharacterized protein YprB with RNaseH-like and TPR domain
MWDESLRQRLEALNRGSLPDPPSRVDSSRSSNRKTVRAGTISGARAIKPLPGLLRTGVVVENESGQHLRIGIPVEDLWQRGPRLITARHEQLARNRTALGDEWAWLVEVFPKRVLLLDLETCGLAGAALFLIGILRCIDGALWVELLLARHYGEERAVLQSFWQSLSTCDVLVTFNGKTFDWPMVLDRSRRHLMFRHSLPQQPLLIDVLHHARRRWKRQVPNCRLQTLEQIICGRRRVGDIPGHRIPGAYAEYVRSGFEREMESILYHNAVDLITLLDLTMRLPG